MNPSIRQSDWRGAAERWPIAAALDFRSSPQASHDAAFISLLAAFRPTGGMARADDLATQLRVAEVGVVARWIVEREVLSIHWNEIYWLPLFQFVKPSMGPCPVMAVILSELSPLLDEWDLAEWFCQPSGWLGDLTPAASLRLSGEAVLQAARADRFAIGG